MLQNSTYKSISSGWNQNVALLRLFPSITATTVRSFLQPPIRGVVLQTYGAGNGPSNRDDIIREVRLGQGYNCDLHGQNRESNLAFSQNV